MVIIKRPRAQADLIEIWDYIADVSQERADDFIDLLDRKFQTSARNPALGRPRRELVKDLRSFPVGRHVIFYLPLTNGIEIIRVLHSARDIDVIFDAEE